MRPEALREATRKASAQERRDERWPPKRLAPGKKRTRKRMAMVAAVYGVAPYPRTPDEDQEFVQPDEDPREPLS